MAGERDVESAATPTFVLVPGAGGDAWYWHLVVEELESRGYDAVAVDLPATDDTAGFEEYAEVVVAAAADRRPLVLVAQSMGGLTVPLVCQRLPVALIVLVNAMIPRPGESGGAWWEATGQAQARAEHAAAQGRTVSDAVDPQEDFLHDLSGEALAEALRRGDPQQSGTPFAAPVAFEGWPDVPTRVLAGRDDRFFPPSFQRRVARERLGITPDEIPGGHLVALANPAAVGERLDAYWRAMARSSTR
jgi:pimeloyl-ACP methyl ester carboxylesterase